MGQFLSSSPSKSSPTAAATLGKPSQDPPASFRTSRPNIVGPDAPLDPYPIRLEGAVQHGFGRGSKDLGCPTANLPDESITYMVSVAKPGVYYGYARVYPRKDQPTEFTAEHLVVLPMVMSLGWNPFYKNQRMTAEIHILYQFQSDFYGCDLKALVLGYIRPELDYISRGKYIIPAEWRPDVNSRGLLEALIDDIETDKRVALNSLARTGYESYASDPFFSA